MIATILLPYPKKHFLNTCYFLVALLAMSCKNNSTLFNKIPAEKSGIAFNNVIIENDSINPIDMEFLYNGGGVAVGDFNTDGLPDLYFTASMVPNKLYLNKGNLSFTDVTAQAGVDGAGTWCNAASVVDINNDGLEDIYLCTTVKTLAAERTKLLSVNQGKNAAGIPVFAVRRSVLVATALLSAPGRPATTES